MGQRGAHGLRDTTPQSIREFNLSWCQLRDFVIGRFPPFPPIHESRPRICSPRRLLFRRRRSPAAEPDYPLSEDSQPHANVPKGDLIKFDFAESKIFPGTTRQVTVYVPKQYDPAKPACVYVNQDGIQYNAPAVFDDLIDKNEMPVTIGVFVTPGASRRLAETPRSTASTAATNTTAWATATPGSCSTNCCPRWSKRPRDGRAINLLAQNGNDRAIGGSSSGAICAFIGGLGTARRLFAASSARSAPMSACAAATSTRP